LVIFEGCPQICQGGVLVRTATPEFSDAGSTGVDVDAGGLTSGVVGGEVVGLIKLGMIEFHSFANYQLILQTYD
jgi:hypothetical protein